MCVCAECCCFLGAQVYRLCLIVRVLCRPVAIKCPYTVGKMKACVSILSVYLLIRVICKTPFLFSHGCGRRFQSTRSLSFSYVKHPVPNQHPSPGYGHQKTNILAQITHLCSDDEEICLSYVENGIIHFFCSFVSHAQHFIAEIWGCGNVTKHGSISNRSSQII